jgi:SNF2 family DNA or RNA helicase
MDMGTGKSKVSIDTAAWNYQMGMIDCLVIIAPNGVHRNWIYNEIPAHMPDWTNHRSVVWASYMRKKEQEQVDNLFERDFTGLKVVAINIEAFRDSTTCKAGLFVRKLCQCFKVLMIVDESSKIKTPGAKRTNAICTLGKQAVMRRICTGTPVTNSPLDIYSQFRFLGNHLLGFDNFFSFKHYYSEWEKEIYWNKNKKENDTYEVLTGYRNIDELTQCIEAHGYRVTKEECLDLPEKIYETRYVALSSAQRKVYNDIAERALIELEDGGEMTVANVLVKALRLQQVVGGFIPKEEFGEAKPIEPSNPRINALMDFIEETSGKVIIWARFRPELAAIEKALIKEYGRKLVVSYHGGVPDADREESKCRFQGERPIINPDTYALEGFEKIPDEEQARFFVGQQHSGGYGITLTAATTVVYFSNDFSLEARLQSEDRAHRIGQHHPVVYIDLECQGTIDTKVLVALRNKMSLADMVTKDSVRLLLARAA